MYDSCHEELHFAKPNVCTNTHTNAIYCALNLTFGLLYKEIFYVLSTDFIVNLFSEGEVWALELA